jgi:hypothetical protein
MARECYSCGSMQGATPFARKRKGAPLLCADCASEPPPRVQEFRPVTRASYRAAKRYRDGLAQGDLVDLISPCP